MEETYREVLSDQKVPCEQKWVPSVRQPGWAALRTRDDNRCLGRLMFGHIVWTSWHCFSDTVGGGDREDMTCEWDPRNQRLLGPSLPRSWNVHFSPHSHSGVDIRTSKPTENILTSFEFI